MPNSRGGGKITQRSDCFLTSAAALLCTAVKTSDQSRIRKFGQRMGTGLEVLAVPNRVGAKEGRQQDGSCVRGKEIAAAQKGQKNPRRG